MSFNKNYTELSTDVLVEFRKKLFQAVEGFDWKAQTLGKTSTIWQAYADLQAVLYGYSITSVQQWFINEQVNPFDLLMELLQMFNQGSEEENQRFCNALMTISEPVWIILMPFLDEIDTDKRFRSVDLRLETFSREQPEQSTESITPIEIHVESENGSTSQVDNDSATLSQDESDEMSDYSEISDSPHQSQTPTSQHQAPTAESLLAQRTELKSVETVIKLILPSTEDIQEEKRTQEAATVRRSYFW